MTLVQILFLVIAAITLFSAGMVVGARRIMHSALWLVLALMGVAMIFALLDASFFAVVQLLVYIGAIAILIIFVIMLVRGAMDSSVGPLNRGAWLPGLGVVVLFVGLALALRAVPGFNTLPPPLPSAANDIGALGLALVSPNGFAIPFEVSSVLLMAALIGAVYLGSESKGGKK